MTKDEIIKLAREAGIDVSLYDMGAASCVFSEGCHGVARTDFEHFAIACYKAGRTAERSACDAIAGMYAKRVEQTKQAHYRLSDQPFSMERFGFDQDLYQMSRDIRDAIQARGKP